MSIPARSRGELNVAKRTSLATARVQLPVVEFIHRQGASGFLLLCAAIVAIAWANSPWSSAYFRLWNTTLGFDGSLVRVSKSLHHWVNDGLMSIFFFLVGMEIKHEFVRGQLSSWRRAVLPIVAALGGMIAPALFYLLCNINGNTRGWGVPMATDIAFALAVAAVVPRVPLGLKVFLLALAIADDLGAIVVIAIFYTDTLRVVPLILSAVFLLAIWALRTAGVRLAFPYVVLGVIVWICVLKSGIHATLAGVALAFLVASTSPLNSDQYAAAVTPLLDQLKRALSSGDREREEMALGAIETLTSQTEPPLERITRQLHSAVSFVILPLFAFANAGVVVDLGTLKAIVNDPITWGIAAGLLLGKPLGIVGFSWIAIKAGIAELPERVRWPQMWGAGLLGGVGFTVAIFIATLAFDTDVELQSAKITILATSALAGVLGYILLQQVQDKKSPA